MHRWLTATLAAAALLVPGIARAGLVPVQVSVVPDGGMYRFTYAILLPTDAVLRPSDYFTIYDFDGFVPGTNMVSGTPSAGDWSFSTTATGPTPGGTLPTDDPTKPNLTWTYTGPGLGLEASLGLGNFWANSLYPDTTQSWFTAQTGTTSGVTDSNVTPTTVPVPVAPPVGLPEPTALALVALGLPLVALGRRWRGKVRPSA